MADEALDGLLEKDEMAPLARTAEMIATWVCGRRLDREHSLEGLVSGGGLRRGGKARRARIVDNKGGQVELLTAQPRDEVRPRQRDGTIAIVHREPEPEDVAESKGA